MKKILFTIQWYKIDHRISNSANSLCDENIIDELKKNTSYEIHTLSYAVDGYPLEEIRDRVHVHRFKRSWFWNQLINIQQGPNRKLYAVLHYIQRILMRIKQLLTIPVYPIYEPFLIMNFAKNALKLHQRENFDMVVSVHYGTDSLYAGYYLKKKCPNVKYVAICWDSISGSNLVKYLPPKYALLKKRDFEYKIATIADAMIVMDASKELHRNNKLTIDYFNKLFFLDVPYFCPISFSKERDVQIVGNPLKVMFSGNMTGRDPSYLYKLFDKYPTPVVFTFICHTRFHQRLYKLSEGFSNVTVRCIPYMNHENLIKIQLMNDILINFGVKNPNAISGKIFDYMSTGKAVLSTISIDNEACIKYLKQYPRGLIIDERLTIDQNIFLLRSFIDNISKNPCSFAEINDLFWNCKPEAYRNTIETIIEGKHGI